MPRIIETIVYQFDELSDEAKEKAREWFRKGFEFDHEHIVDDAATMAEFIGITITHRRLGSHAIYFSGFGSQGDGACFEGTWRARDVEPGQVKENAPQDTELQRIAKVFEKYSRIFPEGSFEVKNRHYGNHSGCASFDFSLGDKFDLAEDEFVDEVSEEEIDEAEEDLKQAARDLMDWIYHQLEKEYEYQNSDEVVDENIRCNEYEFLEDGSRA
jgi:hypothetical protein